VQRWLARYRATGLAGLVRAQRSDTGHRKLPAALVDVIEGMALRKPRPSVAAIHRTMRELAPKRQWTPPSYSSVYGIVRHLNPAMVTLAQDGPAAFRDRYELIYRHRAEGPNAIWQADHTLLDIRVVPQYDRTKFHSPAHTPMASSSKCVLRLRKPWTKIL